MRSFFPSPAQASAVAAFMPFLLSSCSSPDATSEGGGGGSAGSSSGAAGSAGTGATAGSSSGGSATGGSAQGGSAQGGSATGGDATGGTGTGGSATGGAATGGSSTGGTGGMGATSGSGGAGVGGMGPTLDDGDMYVSNVSVAVHAQVRTILVVTWTQAMAADQTWLEFTFESGSVLRSRAKPGAAGSHRDVVLGVPGQTPVAIRIVSSAGGTQHRTREYMGTTGAVPAGFPQPTVLAYEASIASPHLYLLGAVEDSEGGGDVDYYRAPSWLFVMDRRGRIVWYYTDAAVDQTFGFVRAARDGGYIWSELRPFGGGGQRGVVKMTLDREYFEPISVNLSDCIDVTDDGALLYDTTGTLMERSRAGQSRTIWSCRTAFGQSYNCYTNTVQWNPTSNTVFMSFPEPRTVVEIDRASGMLVAQFGAGSGAYAFAPPLSTPPTAWSFGFQHFPNLNAAGNLMLSSHMPGYEVTSNPVANQHAFLEFSIDRTNRRLTEVWRYTQGPEWAHAKGMAIRLANGNTLANYGTGGVIREITPDKRTAFHVKFDTPGANDFYNKMIGNTFFVDDLYALNTGPN
jgi:hypothetical protein